MSVAINEVAISGGPLPEGDLCAYSYDPITSCVFLTRLLDEVPPAPTNVLAKSGAAIPTLSFTGTLYPGVIKLKFSSTLNTKVGIITLKNDANQTLFKDDLYCTNVFDTTRLPVNTYGKRINDQDIYTLTIETVTATDIVIIELELPTAAGSSVVYNDQFDQLPSLTNVSSFGKYNLTLSNYNPINTSWGYTRKNGRHLALQTLAPFPPPFYDTDWFNLMDYPETTNYVHDSVNIKAQPFFDSETFLSTPDLSKVVKIIDDIYARPTPTLYSIALITQEDNNRQYFWRCIRESRIETVTTHNTSYYVNKWVPSEKVYKYKAGSVYFGGKDFSGPLNSILVDSQDGVTTTESRVLDLNEFPVNAQNELYVHAYTCNYSSSASKVYCVLNKQTGRMAEIDAVTKLVKYFTVVVPVDNEICQLYYTNRLMYTVRNVINNVFSLYDANNNGVLIQTFDLGTYDPSVTPQFTIIN